MKCSTIISDVWIHVQSEAAKIDHQLIGYKKQLVHRLAPMPGADIFFGDKISSLARAIQIRFNEE